MPDREKVIKGLEHCTKWRDCKGCPYFSLLYFEEVDGELTGYKCKCLTEALALLKEQEAKSIIRKQCKREYPDGTVEYFAEWHCPHCDYPVTCGFDAPWIKYCYKCGKPILWESR